MWSADPERQVVSVGSDEKRPVLSVVRRCETF
jgi:hypothetical protein